MYLSATISNENIAFLAMIVFPVLLFGGFLLQWLVRSLRSSTQMALYELSRGPIETFEEIPEEDKLPGYDTLTKQDYDEIYNILKEELLMQMAAQSGAGGDSSGDNKSKSKK